VQTALGARAPAARIRTLDFWSLMDGQVAEMARQTYLSLVQDHPATYDRLYQVDERVWRDVLIGGERSSEALTTIIDLVKDHIQRSDEAFPGGVRHPGDRFLVRLLCATFPGNGEVTPSTQLMLRIALVKWSWARLVRRIAQEAKAWQPDVIVATQMCPAALLAAARSRYGLQIPILGVLTDFGVHDFWVQSGIDRYCVAHPSVANLESLEPERVIVTGIPLMPGFRAPPTQEEARRALGLALDRPMVLVPGGGLGLGVDGMTARLLKATRKAQVVAMTGQCEVAAERLRALAGAHEPRLRVWPWTNRVEQLLAAADVVVGKPGGLTVAETLACGRPLYPARALRGQEGFNVQFLEKHGVGRLLSDEELPAAMNALLGDPGRLAALQAAAWSLGRRDGSTMIAEQALTLARYQADDAAAKEIA
jgi:processive 1,2-diacylglycerol beta-glucosyltransferase